MVIGYVLYQSDIVVQHKVTNPFLKEIYHIGLSLHLVSNSSFGMTCGPLPINHL